MILRRSVAARMQQAEPRAPITTNQNPTTRSQLKNTPNGGNKNSDSNDEINITVTRHKGLQEVEPEFQGGCTWVRIPPQAERVESYRHAMEHQIERRLGPRPCTHGGATHGVGTAHTSDEIQRKSGTGWHPRGQNAREFARPGRVVGGRTRSSTRKNVTWS